MSFKETIEDVYGFLGDALDPSKLIICIIFDPLRECGPWKHTKTHCVKFSLLKTAWDWRYDLFWLSYRSSYSNIGYLEVSGGILDVFRYMEVSGGIWGYMDVYKGMGVDNGGGGGINAVRALPPM